MDYKLPKDYKKPDEKDLYNAFKIPKIENLNEITQKTAEELTRIGREREEYIANQYYDKGYQNAKAKYDRDHGHWEEFDGKTELRLICSKCSYHYTEADPCCAERFNYCPNCGAQMDEEVEDNAVD